MAPTAASTFNHDSKGSPVHPMSDPVRLIYSRHPSRPSHDNQSNAPSPAVRRWKVVRRDDRLVLGRYVSRPKACSAATRFGADGCTYDVVEDAGSAASNN